MTNRAQISGEDWSFQESSSARVIRTSPKLGDIKRLVLLGRVGRVTRPNSR